MRFALEVVEEVQKLIGEDFPLMVRLAADEFVPGGNTLKEAKEIAKRLEECGVDAISVASGTFGASPSFNFGASWPVYQKKGFLEPYAAEIKDVISIPVVLVGALHFVEIAERILEEEKADFIAIGRGMVADPEIPRKLLEGRPEDIRRCIRCNECVTKVITYRPISCTVNAAAGMESRRQITKAEKVKKVLVVGGGPGGMEAARIAALRGHEVALYEKQNKLGGNLIPAAAPEFKEELEYLREWFSTQLKKLNVNVQLGREVTRDTVLEMNPDVVLIGTGATSLVPEIPGIDRAASAIEVLLGERQVGSQVVVAGGGLVGCELALYLAGQGKSVTILEMMDDILLESNPINKAAVMENLMEKGIEWLTNVKIQEVTEEGVIAVDKNWERHSFEGDMVSAFGLAPVTSLYESLKEEMTEVYAVGDCVAPRKIGEAIHEGFIAASQI
jgi:NADPH-dependent 2,4-dienoyl-CoA reductase/sulfur reductase-like enzyme